MATKILLKKSVTGGASPLTSDLDQGELAINLVDRKIYTKDSGNNIKEISGAYVDASAPSNPVEGDLWYDTANNILKAHNGTAFAAVDTNTVYTHPAGDGNLHVPANGTTNDAKVLTAGATAGVYTWETPSLGVTDHTLLSNIGTLTHTQLETAQALNNAKVTNVSTDLSKTATTTNVTINSSDGNNVAIGSASTSVAGVMTKVIFDEHVVNNAKVSNVGTSLSKTPTVSDVTINSSDGTNVAIGPATTLSAGVMTKAIFDEHVVNNAKVSNVVHPLVETAVPSGAVFTDTVYDSTAIDAAVALNTAKLTNVSTNLSKTATTTNVTINSSDGNNIAIGAASASVAGVMTKAVFDEHVVNNGKVSYTAAAAVALNTAKVTNVSTNLGYTTAASQGTVTSSDGSNATLPAATTSLAGLMTGADKVALNAALSAEADTLATVTGRGATTATAVTITNATASTNTGTGALKVTGGAGIGGNLNVGGNAIITGNLTVNGTTTSVNSNTVNIGDSIITLNSDEAGTPSQNGGFEVERGTSTNVSFVWNETDDKWDLNNEELQNVILDGGTY